MKKQQLLALMAELDACAPALNYVTAHPSDDALRIVLDCSRPDWLISILIKVKALPAAFIFGCADRAVRIYVPATLRKAGKEDLAAELEALPQIVDEKTAHVAKDYIGYRYAYAYKAAYMAAYHAAYHTTYHADDIDYATRCADWALQANYDSVGLAALADPSVERDIQLKALHSYVEDYVEKRWKRKARKGRTSAVGR